MSRGLGGTKALQLKRSFAVTTFVYTPGYGADGSRGILEGRTGLVLFVVDAPDASSGRAHDLVVALCDQCFCDVANLARLEGNARQSTTP